ncbi:hypothetical protein MSAN_02234200 [Mycena sanguinolenta]|uniref:Uncharacterized protein n=1 Tax=Mycena sanguinolenta TaxID=230812 RepID=A0A8H6XBT7_9AGAR|nr:hypothetical protein MSAN_02234200 [Mycena sanguinolenta]
MSNGDPALEKCPEFGDIHFNGARDAMMTALGVDNEEVIRILTAEWKAGREIRKKEWDESEAGIAAEAERKKKAAAVRAIAHPHSVVVAEITHDGKSPFRRLLIIPTSDKYKRAEDVPTAHRLNPEASVRLKLLDVIRLIGLLLDLEEVVVKDWEGRAVFLEIHDNKKGTHKDLARVVTNLARQLPADARDKTDTLRKTFTETFDLPTDRCWLSGIQMRNAVGLEMIHLIPFQLGSAVAFNLLNAVHQRCNDITESSGEEFPCLHSGSPQSVLVQFIKKLITHAPPFPPSTPVSSLDELTAFLLASFADAATLFICFASRDLRDETLSVFEELKADLAAIKGKRKRESNVQNEDDERGEEDDAISTKKKGKKKKQIAGVDPQHRNNDDTESHGGGASGTGGGSSRLDSTSGPGSGGGGSGSGNGSTSGGSGSGSGGPEKNTEGGDVPEEGMPESNSGGKISDSSSYTQLSLVGSASESLNTDVDTDDQPDKNVKINYPGLDHVWRLFTTPAELVRDEESELSPESEAFLGTLFNVRELSGDEEERFEVLHQKIQIFLTINDPVHPLKSQLGMNNDQRHIQHPFP